MFRLSVAIAACDVEVIDEALDTEGPAAVLGLLEGGDEGNGVACGVLARRAR